MSPSLRSSTHLDKAPLVRERKTRRVKVPAAFEIAPVSYEAQPGPTSTTFST